MMQCVSLHPQCIGTECFLARNEKMFLSLIVILKEQCVSHSAYPLGGGIGGGRVPVTQERIREGGVGRRKRRGKWEERETECPTEVLCLVIAQPGRRGERERRDSAGKWEPSQNEATTGAAALDTFGRQETMDKPQVSGRKKTQELFLWNISGLFLQHLESSALKNLVNWAKLQAWRKFLPSSDPTTAWATVHLTPDWLQLTVGNPSWQTRPTGRGGLIRNLEPHHWIERESCAEGCVSSKWAEWKRWCVRDGSESHHPRRNCAAMWVVTLSFQSQQIKKKHTEMQCCSSWMLLLFIYPHVKKPNEALRGLWYPFRSHNIWKVSRTEGEKSEDAPTYM